jgi:hypothetical protein
MPHPQNRPVRLPASKSPKLQKQARNAKIQAAVLRTQKAFKPRGPSGKMG